MKVTIVHDFVKKNNKTMLLLSFCNFFFSFGWNKKKLSLMKKNNNKKSINDTKPKQVKMFDNEDEQRATDSARVSLADCTPPWAPILNAVLPPPSTAQPPLLRTRQPA